MAFFKDLNAIYPQDPEANTRATIALNNWAKNLVQVGNGIIQELRDIITTAQAQATTTQAEVTALKPLVPLMSGGFQLTSSGFLRRWTRGPNGLLTAASSGLVSVSVDIILDLTAQGITLDGNVIDHAFVLSDFRSAQDITYFIFSRTSTSYSIAARRATDNASVSIPSAAANGTGCSFVLLGQAV
jgi:hypothetical protein